jgi:hypothetical protein
MKALIEGEYLSSKSSHATTQDDQLLLPPHTSFVGIRLQGPHALPLGLLMVCHDQTKAEPWYEETHQLIKSVATRTMRELSGIRDSERLTKAKNDATQDAESKIKFLADMSHEIR